MVLVIISFLAGTYIIDKSAIEKKGYDTGYSAGYNIAWNKATKLIDSVQMPIFPQPKEIYSIRGKIVSVRADSLTLEADPVSLNPLSEDSKRTTREIKISSDTKIIKRTAKTPEEIQAMLAQNKTFYPFSEEEISFSQLKGGDRITALSDKDIKYETNIIATEIVIVEPQ